MEQREGIFKFRHHCLLVTSKVLTELELGKMELAFNVVLQLGKALEHNNHLRKLQLGKVMGDLSTGLSHLLICEEQLQKLLVVAEKKPFVFLRTLASIVDIYSLTKTSIKSIVSFKERNEFLLYEKDKRMAISTEKLLRLLWVTFKLVSAGSKVLSTTGSIVILLL